LFWFYTFFDNAMEQMVGLLFPFSIYQDLFFMSTVSFVGFFMSNPTFWGFLWTDFPSFFILKHRDLYL